MCPGVSAGAEGTAAGAEVVAAGGGGGAPYCAAAKTGNTPARRTVVKIMFLAEKTWMREGIVRPREDAQPY